MTSQESEFDADDNGEFDLRDFAVFQNSYTGPAE